MDRQQQASQVIQPYFESAIRHCIATGIPMDDAVSVLLQMCCGAMKGALPADTTAREMLRLRDEIFAELTLCADRCTKQ